MGGKSHQESSLRVPGSNHDMEKPNNFDTRPSDTKDYERSQTGRSHPRSGAAIGNVVHHSRDDVSSRDSDISSSSSPSWNSSSSGYVCDQGSRTFTSHDGQRNITNTTSFNGENKGQQLGRYHAEDRDSDTITSKNRNEVVNATFGRNHQGRQYEVFNADTGFVDFNAGGPCSTGSRDRVIVRGVHFDMVSPRPNRETGHQGDEPPPQKAPSLGGKNKSTAEESGNGVANHPRSF